MTWIERELQKIRNQINNYRHKARRYSPAAQSAPLRQLRMGSGEGGRRHWPQMPQMPEKGAFGERGV
jgi:hypothetical protein